MWHTKMDVSQNCFGALPKKIWTLTSILDSGADMRTVKLKLSAQRSLRCPRYHTLLPYTKKECESRALVSKVYDTLVDLMVTSLQIRPTGQSNFCCSTRPSRVPVAARRHHPPCLRPRRFQCRFPARYIFNREGTSGQRHHLLPRHPHLPHPHPSLLPPPCLSSAWTFSPGLQTRSAAMHTNLVQFRVAFFL